MVSELIIIDNVIFMRRKRILKTVIYIAIAVIAFSLAACSKTNENNVSVDSKTKLRNANSLKKPFHGEMGPTSKVPVSLVLQSLKKNHLQVSANKTIGDAFDNYTHATKKEWRETVAENGSYFVDYICWLDISPVSLVALKEGVVKRAVDIKFAIRSNGETYIGMASRIDIKSDGQIYTTAIEPADIPKIVAAIYDNREIPF